MTGNPHVLLISPEYPPIPGGIGDYTALLARHLGLTGATVAVLTTGTARWDALERDDSGASVLRAIPHWGWNLAAQVRHAARRTGADVVHIQYQTGMYAMHPAINLLPRSLKGRFRVVTTFHDLRAPYLFPKAGPLRDRATRFLARTSNAVIVTNGADTATMRKWGVQPALVPIGSNIPATPQPTPTPEAWRRFCLHYGIAPDAVLLTTFGLLNQSKGLDTVIDTLALLREGGIPAHLLMVGAGAGANDPTNHATDAALSSRIVARELAAFVSRTGTLDASDVADALAWGRVCLLPYRDGASPRRGSLLAALTQAVPVVTTEPEPGAYGGLPPLNGETVALVPPGDAPATVAAVRRILADATYAARLRQHAHAYAAIFDWSTIARRTLAVYAGKMTAPDDWQPGVPPPVRAGMGMETGQQWR